MVSPPAEKLCDEYSFSDRPLCCKMFGLTGEIRGWNALYRKMQGRLFSSLPGFRRTVTTNQNNQMRNDMENEKHRDVNNMGTLAEDAQALMAATVDVAGEKVSQARKRLAAALESGKDLYSRARKSTAEKAKAVDETVRGHPYQTIGIAFGLGVLIGVLLNRGNSRDESE
jgi:ElaB/YqjD/DUF883 family membrane-anchored ribosome-binding protein